MVNASSLPVEGRTESITGARQAQRKAARDEDDKSILDFLKFEDDI